ncbi:M23 family metallopeptidase [Nodosilinea sp. AN01ver1]|uniref:M23 family metallopeptidase n=1 Tax=Nodosilinea sp. AN01ver1 TaxID=3423362 RepID=UPI003D30F2AA
MIGRLRTLPRLSFAALLKPRWVKTTASSLTKRIKTLPRPQALLGLGLSTAIAVAVFMPRATPPASAQQLTAALWTRASFPVENFQTYTSPFGYRSDPYSGSSRFHYGLDLAAPNGSYIRNWWAGEVLWVEGDGACGTSIAIKSGEWTHIYCHMQGHVEGSGQGKTMVDRDGGIQLRAGQSLPAGARIGRVGMTGRTTGPHLHWGLKYQDNWVDPALVLQAMYVGQQAAL